MKQSKFPDGWGEKRVQKAITHYEQQSAEEAVAEDEAAFGNESKTLVEIPRQLIPAVRELIAKHEGNKVMPSS